VEYNNTIRDLVGIDFHAPTISSDDVGYGFDNIGDVLSMAPILMEKYLDAAERIVAKAFRAPQVRQRIVFANRPNRRRSTAPGRLSSALRFAHIAGRSIGRSRSLG